MSLLSTPLLLERTSSKMKCPWRSVCSAPVSVRLVQRALILVPRRCFLVTPQESHDMIKKLSVLVLVLCSGAGYAYSQANQPSAFFDPAGLISPSQHGKVTTLGTGFKFAEGPAAD